jgi:hypothetical protein
MEPKEAGEAAATLSQALTKTTDPHQLQQLAAGLSAVSTRMEPKEAAAVCGQAAATLSQALTKTTDLYQLQQLAAGLSAVSTRMEPKEAGEAAATLSQAMTKWTDRTALEYLAHGLSAVLRREDPGWNEMTKMNLPYEALATLTEAMTKKTFGTIGTLTSPGALLLAPALFWPPPPLPAQTLVDLLKHPFCVGEARRLVLEQLARHYERPFADQWDFVRFAQEQELDLDLLTPPQRPERAALAR